MKLVVIGMIMNVTQDELDYNYEKYDNKVTESNPYLRGDKVTINKKKAQDADDIFDVDMAITHHPGTVAESFEGWTGANIENVIGAITDNWEALYGLKDKDYTELLKTKGSTATALTEAQINEIIGHAKEILGDDPEKIDRINALKTGLFYVGKISYSQDYHGTALRVGGQNDCSGFASRVDEKAFGKGVIWDTGSFWREFNARELIHPFSDGNCKPGDVLLHYDGAIADNSGDHALVYIGEIDGKHMSMDCTGSGTWYRCRDDDTPGYVQECYYIDLTGLYSGVK